MIQAIDLCCGAGGWACAARGLPISFRAVADLARDCCETWELNHRAAHPGCRILPIDLSTADGRDAICEAISTDGSLGRIDLIVGAIPCEQVSCARANRPLKKGELEEVHALIDSCFELVRRIKPRWWVFEGVIGIEPHLPPPIVAGMPYQIRRIHAEEYGPQKRLRCFFGRFPDPAPQEPGPRTLGDILRPGPYRTLPQLKKYQRSKSKWYGGDKMRVQDTEEPAATVISSQGGTGSRSERSGMVPIPEREAVRLARVLDTGEPCPTVADYSSRHERAALVPSGQARVFDPGLPSPKIVADGDDLVRVMEWQEAAMLQGFPADYVFAASWSRTWKLVAQAIPIYVGRAILRAIAEEAEKSPRKGKRGVAT